MPTVFVSHSSQDHEIVHRRIVALLERHGLETFYSRDSIHGAEEWEKRIRQGLTSCPWFLVALSPNSVHSEWVQAEVGWAVQNRRGRLVPVLIDDCQPEDCHLRLTQIQYIDLRQDQVEQQQRLLAVLVRTDNDHPNAMPGGTGPATNRPHQASRKSVRGTAIIALMGSTVAAALIWYFGVRTRDDTAKIGHATVDTPHVVDAAVPSAVPATSRSANEQPEVVIAVDLAQNIQLVEPDEVNTTGNPDNDPFKLSYHFDHRDGVLVVDYTLPYLEVVRQGGPIHGLRPRPYDWQFPQLSVKVLNNSPRTVMLARCIFEIHESVPNDEPLISIAEGSLIQLIFLNDGWGDVIDPVVTFKVTSGDNEGEELLFAVESHTLEFPTFGDIGTVPIGKYIPQHLADRPVVQVSGVLQYGPASQRRELAFSTHVNLASYPGDPSPPTNKYDIALKAGQAPWTFPLSISQQIRSDDTDHFLLRIGSDQSARYEMTLKFIAVDGSELGRQVVRLHVFVPRMAAKLVQQADELESTRTTPSGTDAASSETLFPLNLGVTLCDVALSES